MSERYDHPEFSVIREKHYAAAMSVSAVGTAYAGSTLRVYTKCAVVGVWYRVGSGGSASGTNSLIVGRVQAAGTFSTYQVATTPMSAGASAAGDASYISLSSPMTLVSAGEWAALGCNAASVDKCAVMSDIIWRYRVLQGEIPKGG